MVNHRLCQEDRKEGKRKIVIIKKEKTKETQIRQKNKKIKEFSERIT